MGVAGSVAGSGAALAEEIRVVESFFEALRAQDQPRALSLMSEDVVYQNVPFPASRGKPAVEQTLKSFGRVVKGFDLKMVNIAARGNVVLTERVDILTGPLLYLDLPVCGTFEVVDGKIALWRDTFDLATATFKLVVSPIRWLLHRP